MYLHKLECGTVPITPAGMFNQNLFFADSTDIFTCEEEEEEEETTVRRKQNTYTNTERVVQNVNINWCFDVRNWVSRF